MRKSLLLESITHLSHFSILSISSYQRLEYLNDALLDYVVTTIIFSHEDLLSSALQFHRMHMLRVAAVNVSFLAFRSLLCTISILTANIASPESNKAPSLILSETSTSLPKFLHHAFIPALASALRATRTRFATLEPVIVAAFSRDLVHPKTVMT